MAVAAGLVPIAIGTDTGGSVRTPAAFNGVVGFKTSERRIDSSGVFPLSQALDTIGVFAHDWRTAICSTAALRGFPAVLPARDEATDYFAAVNLKTIRKPTLGSMLNACGLALPNGFGAAQMPTSLLLSAPAGQEVRLLRAGMVLAGIIADDNNRLN